MHEALKTKIEFASGNDSLCWMEVGRINSKTKRNANIDGKSHKRYSGLQQCFQFYSTLSPIAFALPIWTLARIYIALLHMWNVNCIASFHVFVQSFKRLVGWVFRSWSPISDDFIQCSHFLPRLRKYQMSWPLLHATFMYAILLHTILQAL